MSVTKTQSMRFCAQPPRPRKSFDPGVSSIRAASIINNLAYWNVGTRLTYWFFDGPDSQKLAMRQAFKIWENVGIGIEFEEVDSQNQALIRISFNTNGPNSGSWSYVGRDILSYTDKQQPTMNIGWDISTDIDTGVHEIGHTLGFEHEHQNPNSGIIWNDQAVYQSFAQPPNNWDPQKTYWNIIRKLDPSTVTGTKWDPDSIMHYPFGPQLIVHPPQYFLNGLTPAGGLSTNDIDWVKRVYPLTAGTIRQIKPFRSETISADTGDSLTLLFKPDETRKYSIRTFGKTDSVMVLDEIKSRSNKVQYIAGTDDSGHDINGLLEERLEKGKTYRITIRMHYREANSDSSIMIW